MTHFSNLSGLNVEREGTITKRAYKAHLAELQQRLRDLQEEIRQVTGGGRGQVPASKAKKSAFRLSAPDTATADAKVEVSTSLRTTTKSRVQSDLVTRAELASSVAAASSATGFLDLTTNQSISSGNKDFGSLSVQRSFYALTPGTKYSTMDLSGATYWSLAASTSTAADVIIDGIQPPSPDTNMLRILVWRSKTSNLVLYDTTNDSAGAPSGNRILTLSGTTASTVGFGSFILLYDTSSNFWIIVARNA